MARGGVRAALTVRARTRAASGLAAAAAGLALAAASPGRTVPDIDAAPWRAIVRVQTELGTRCTGFLVAPALAITAAHCLALPRVGRLIDPGSVHVLLGLRGDRFRAHARVRAFRLAPGFDPAREGGAPDRAVLVLDHAIGDRADLLALAPTVPPPGTPVMLGGFARDAPALLTADTACRLGPAIGGLIRSDCVTVPGDSGAPLLARRSDGRWAAIGVAIGTTPDGGAVATPLGDG